MLKLKRILIEGLEKIDVPVGQIPADVIFTLSETDPWEYMVKSADKTIYTRKKGEKQWKPMREVAADFNLAKQRLANMDKFKTSASNKNEIPSKKEDENKLEIDKYLVTDYKIQTNIIAALFDMITKNPAKYFAKFKSIVNDNELGAAEFFKKQQTQFETQLSNIKNKDNEDIKLNTKLIKNIMDDVYKSIKNNSPLKKSIQLTDPTYKASSSNETKYRTYTALIWWQYFKN